jgi:signal transduction histidine kinase/CheY-like chemotaxis protein
VAEKKNRVFEKFSIELNKHFIVHAIVLDESQIGLVFYDISPQKLDEERYEHMRNVMNCIRRVNQLINKEKTRDEFLSKVCDVLISSGAYNTAWIALFKNNMQELRIYRSGFDESTDQYFVNLVKNNRLPLSDITEDDPVAHMIYDPQGEKENYPIYKNMLDNSVYYVNLQHEDSFYGVLSLSLLRKYAKDQKELELFHEISKDISRALYAYKIEAMHKEEERQIHMYSEQIKIHNENLRIINQELMNAKIRAEEADRLKSVFLANMSHEIRTPMNGIIGFCELLKKQNIPDEKKTEFLDIIAASGERLTNVIDDLINYSLLEAGQFSISYLEMNVNDLLHDLYAIYKRKAEDKGLELKLKTGLKDKDASIITDGQRVRQILVKLIDNAFKFTSKGSIEIAYKVLKNDSIRFVVKDTGIGIGIDKQRYIFEGFRQADEGATRTYGGTGLGLSISKRIIELMGGEIYLESEHGMGSLFYFDLPYLATLEEVENHKVQQKKKERSKEKSRTCILIVEDDLTNYMYLQEILKQNEFLVLHSEDGEKAVEICRANRNIDLVLMDLKLPRMNGYDATRKIKEFRNDLPIIAHTAYTLTEDRQKSLEAGCTDYITKDVHHDKFIRMIEKYI